MCQWAKASQQCLSLIPNLSLSIPLLLMLIVLIISESFCKLKYTSPACLPFCCLSQVLDVILEASAFIYKISTELSSFLPTIQSAVIASFAYVVHSWFCVIPQGLSLSKNVLILQSKAIKALCSSPGLFCTLLVCTSRLYVQGWDAVCLMFFA